MAGGRLVRKRELYQIGAQVSMGTPVVATHQLAAPVVFSSQDTVERPQTARGFVHRYTGDEVKVAAGNAFSTPSFQSNWEDMVYYMQMGLVGGVAAVGGGPYTWTFERFRRTIPTVNFFTLEHYNDDGATELSHKFEGMFLTDWTLAFEPQASVKFSANGICGASSVVTAASLSPGIKTPMQGHRTELFIDANYAGRGSTSMGLQVRRAALTCRTGYKPFRGLTGNANLDYDDVIYDGDEAGWELDITFFCEQGAGDMFLVEKAAAEALTPRQIQLHTDGPGNMDMLIDLFGKWEPGSLFITGSEDGQQIISAKLVETAAALDADPYISVEMVNDTATI